MRYMVFALIGVLALSAGTANAASVTATFTGVENEEAVHLRYGAQNLYVWAGLYKFEKLSISPDSTENPAYYMDDVFGGYCIDIDQRISFNQTVTWVLKPLEEAPVNLLHSPMGADKATLLRRLWGSYFGDPPPVRRSASAGRRSSIPRRSRRPWDCWRWDSARSPSEGGFAIGPRRRRSDAAAWPSPAGAWGWHLERCTRFVERGRGDEGS